MCIACGRDKPLSQFLLNKSSVEGYGCEPVYDMTCSPCRKLNLKAYEDAAAGLTPQQIQPVEYEPTEAALMELVDLKSSYNSMKERYEDRSCIYLISHVISGCRYVGQTTNLSNRAYGHRESLRERFSKTASLVRRFRQLTGVEQIDLHEWFLFVAGRLSASATQRTGKSLVSPVET